MPHYVDIAAVRIQTWLARTPNLRGRRGASALLSESTDAAAVTRVLPSGCSVNKEAGDVDGVVSLVADSAESARTGSRDVARHLRAAMPALEIVETVVVEADDYVSAYPEMHAAVAATWQPVAPEISWALPCAYCGHDPATRTRDLSPDRRKQPVCLDCEGRLDRAGFSSASTPGLVPRDHARVLGWLDETGGMPVSFPPDFQALSGLDRGSTHVATVFCDGNRVGTLFEELSSSSQVSKRDLVTGIDGATTAALATAIRQISHGGDVSLPISVHLVGGDDLLVSVPAQRGWQFAVAYLAAFENALSSWRSGLGSLSGSPSPTASAGLIFHHHAYPFSMVVETAERALKAAKVTFSGQQAAIAWADITSDVVAIHGPQSLAWFDAHSGDLEGLAGMPGSQRARLARLRTSDVPDQLRRLGLRSAQRLFQEGPDALADGLSIVKWRQSVE